MTPLLSVEDLTVAFPTAGGPVPVVREASFQVGRGEMVGLVGESGSGKSMTARAILGLVPPPGTIETGRILLDGEDLRRLPERRRHRVRGRRIGMVFQEPTAALDPVFTLGFQITEAVGLHQDLPRRLARRRALELLESVAMPDPARRLNDYPHQLSGGQCQRALLAMALAGEPELLLADEPTTALDVTVQTQILELLEGLRRRLGLAVLLITHNLGVVAQVCERVVVMYAGELVEQAAVEELFTAPAHPYTRALLAATPRLGRPAARGRLATIPGQVPAPSHLPGGCLFHPRCPDVMPVCRRRRPPRFPLGAGREARCFLHGEEP